MILCDEMPMVEPPVQASRCPLNQGVLSSAGRLESIPINMYVDDALLTAIREHMSTLLAATIEAIFVVMGSPQVELRKCPLALDKWEGMLVSHRQVMLRLCIDARRMSVSIANSYRHDLYQLMDTSWPDDRPDFTVPDMQAYVPFVRLAGVRTPAEQRVSRKFIA